MRDGARGAPNNAANQRAVIPARFWPESSLFSDFRFLDTGLPNAGMTAAGVVLRFDWPAAVSRLPNSYAICWLTWVHR